MSRDHTKLRIFERADSLVVSVYSKTKDFPSDEKYGLLSQIRRAAVSIPTNIVEGCGRETEKEFHRFLSIALGSATELRYLLSLSHRLEFLNDEDGPNLYNQCDQLIRQIYTFIQALDGSPKTDGPPKADAS